MYMVCARMHCTLVSAFLVWSSQPLLTRAVAEWPNKLSCLRILRNAVKGTLVMGDEDGADCCGDGFQSLGAAAVG